MKFRDVYTQWANHKKHYVKRSSFSAYTLLAENHLLPIFGDSEEITENQLQIFLLGKLETISNKTIKDVFIVMKMIMKFGVKHKLWNEIPPFQDLEYPTDNQKKEIDILTAAEYKKAVTHVNENFTLRSLGVLICLSTGMRIGEVCALKWSDFDIKEGTVKIQRTIQRIYSSDNGKRKTELIIDSPKTKNSYREIPLSPDLLKIFKSMEKIVNPDFFVLTNDIKPTEPRTYRVYYKELFKQLDLPNIKFHGLRHTFATQCIGANVDVKTVSVLLGHSNVSTTFNLYVHPDMGQKRSAISKLFKAMK